MFTTFAQTVNISNGISLLLHKPTIFPKELHYFWATCRCFLRNFIDQKDDFFSPRSRPLDLSFLQSRPMKIEVRGSGLGQGSLQAAAVAAVSGVHARCNRRALGPRVQPACTPGATGGSLGPPWAPLAPLKPSHHRVFAHFSYVFECFWMFLDVWRGLGGGGRLERVRGAYAHQIVVFIGISAKSNSRKWRVRKHAENQTQMQPRFWAGFCHG